MNLMDLTSWQQRKKYLRFLFLNEKKVENDKKRKAQRKVEREALYYRRLEEERANPPHLKYCLHNNSIFIRICDTAMHHYANNRLVHAMMYGQNLVIDCGYDAYMTMKESSNCAQQLTYAFAENRNNLEPFNLHFCNVGYEDRLIRILKKAIPTMFEESFPMNVTEKHYLDLFPKEKLVYLTPHTNHELHHYDPEDIYIIGALVDKTNIEPLSLAKAKSEGLRMARFPLDRYLDWASGSKSLTLDQCIRIMLTLKETNNWHKALVHVPSRKIVRELEEPDDEVSHYGQSYIGNTFERGHEWGIAKRRERAKLSKHLDLRELLHKKENQ
ncbi:mitochondrial ribonuclease P protein 1 homolog [Nilaparvata lugens]|uniref:mitochondrial ribonuclease P protein 1 homolog n=1 Tax=Nilaparvata lugens TaxID=108931 RepID=UPI00193EA9C5|nr:mitochondrial ribonuclease P protein 1 homolog [Nilaparvata lugens]